VPEGFGAQAVGGAGQPVLHVTNLNNTGTGSLRSLLQSAASNRYIVFDVGGTINLATALPVGGHHITIDGSTAPAPGITLANGTLSFETDGGGTANHIVVTNIRHRGPSGSRSGWGDNIAVTEGAHDILLDRISTSNAVDGCLDITQATNVTVQWSIIEKHFNAGDSAAGASLVKYSSSGVTFHHTIFATEERGPACAVSDTATSSSTTLCDLVNNINWNWGGNGGTQFGYGIGADWGAHSNVVNSYFRASGSYPNLVTLALEVNHDGVGALVYANGNFSGNGVNVDGFGNQTTRFAAPAVQTQSAVAAVGLTRTRAGARPLDSLDNTIVNDIAAHANLPDDGRAEGPARLVPPSQPCAGRARRDAPTDTRPSASGARATAAPTAPITP
jgi:hypothetical protein